MNAELPISQAASPAKVYSVIHAVAKAMSIEGISKGRRNQQQGYSFRGIDDVYAALAPHLAAQGLCILPRVLDRTVIERETKAGGNLFYTTLRVEFDFVAVADGSIHTVVTIGEAMDAGDKSTNKAMSAAYKYACFLTFCIPTDGDNDADAHTHEVAAAGQPFGTAVPSLPPTWEKWTLEERGLNRATVGVEALKHWWEQLPFETRKVLKPRLEEWKAIAAKSADTAR